MHRVAGRSSAVKWNMCTVLARKDRSRLWTVANIRIEVQVAAAFSDRVLADETSDQMKILSEDFRFQCIGTLFRRAPAGVEGNQCAPTRTSCPFGNRTPEVVRYETGYQLLCSVEFVPSESYVAGARIRWIGFFQWLI